MCYQFTRNYVNRTLSDMESKIILRCQVNKMYDFNSINTCVRVCVCFFNAKVHFSYFSAHKLG